MQVPVTLHLHFRHGILLSWSINVIRGHRGLARQLSLLSGGQRGLPRPAANQIRDLGWYGLLRQTPLLTA